MNFLWKHFWVGISKMMLLVYVGLGIIIFLDYRRLTEMGISWRNVWELTSLYSFSDQYLIILIVLFALIIPMVFASVKFLFRQQIGGRFGETSRGFKCFLVVAHIVTFSGVGFVYCLSPAAQRLSGRQVLSDSADYAYKPVIRSAVDSISLYSLIFSAGVWAFTLFASVRTTGQTFAGFSEVYRLWLELAVPEGDLYPLQHRISNFNAGAISPEIRYVSRIVKKTQPSYQRTIPGSKDAADRLREMAAECKRDICELMSIDNSQFKYRIEFHSGTSRALELALARLPKPLVVLVSPFEHPSERDVGMWASRNSDVSISEMKFPAALLEADWEKQEESLRVELQRRVQQGDEHYVLLISEVCYVHGEVIPIEKIMKDFREVNSKRVSFLIDASHAVGNVKGAFAGGKLDLEENDGYVFGGHKWLLSPEPCGVLISSSKNKMVSHAYDTWEHELPKTTVGFHRIGGFSASLKMLVEDHRYENFLRTSKFMKERFLKLREDRGKFSLIGKSSNQNGSNMIAVKPISSSTWKKTNPDELMVYLYGLGVNCKVVDVGDTTPWVRITFSYFNTIADLQKLVWALNDSIQYVL